MATQRVDNLSEDVVDLDQTMTKLTLALEEERSLRVKAENDLYKLQGFVIKQHDVDLIGLCARLSTFTRSLPMRVSLTTGRTSIRVSRSQSWTSLIRRRKRRKSMVKRRRIVEPPRRAMMT